jgi:hypothetical protein
MKTIIKMSCRAFALFVFACFGLLPAPKAFGVVPPPDGGYPGFNTAEGSNALQNLTTGVGNAAVGWHSLFSNTDGIFNSGFGVGALLSNTSGVGNTAVGAAALLSSTGSFNTALGTVAGTDPAIGSNNIYIADTGFPGDNNVIAIGGLASSGTSYTDTYIGGIYGQVVNAGTALAVYVDTDGHLGTNLVSTNGQKVRVRSPQGVQQQAISNESQKHQKRIAELEAAVARLVATVKEQAAQIQRVSAQLELNKPTPQTVLNSQ